MAIRHGIDDGGPAHPTLGFGQTIDAWTDDLGITVRDYFAAVAVAPLVAVSTELAKIQGPLLDDQKIAKCAYQLADAMIEARKAVPRG